jgi:hypothetical protein
MKVQLTKICLECGKSFIFKDKRQKFCNNSCSAKYSNKHRNYNPSDDKRTKQMNCSGCGKKILVDIRAGQNVKCKKCNELRRKKYSSRYIIKNDKLICKYCGQEKCLRPDVCRKHQIFPTLINYFGFDKTKIGTIKIYEEFDRIKNKIIEDYWNKKLSTLDLSKKYMYSSNNIRHFLKEMNISLRNLSSSIRNAVLNGKNISHGINQYKCGWHTTWDNKQVFYRSSYELNYAEELDKQKIEYEMEKLRILYWDTQKQIQRVAISDFYIPSQNKIIEIKSPYTLNEQNMKDKEKAYKEHGYKFELIVM